MQEHGYHSNLYIQGNGLDLTWNNVLPLQKRGPDTWTILISYNSSIDGFGCSECSDNSLLLNNKLQFRISAENWKDMEGPNFAINFPISATSQYFEEVPEFVVYPWFFTTEGSSLNFSIDSIHIGQTRQLLLYLPPSFRENIYKSYPGIFMFDLDTGYHVVLKNALQGPIYPHKISEEYIVIGFADYNGSRDDLLTPTVGSSFICINGTFENNCDGCLPTNVNNTVLLYYLTNICGKVVRKGGKGDDTLDFLLYEVLPEAMTLTDSRLDNSSLGIMGYSLGGLMSCYAAWTRPYNFKYASCSSPSFWWPADENYTACNFDFLNKTLKDPNLWVNRPEQKIYIDAGGAEIDDPFSLTQAAVESAAIISTNEFFTLNENLWIHVSPGKQHSMVEFNSRLWKGFKTLLPAAGDPDRPTEVHNESNHSHNLAWTFKGTLLMTVLVVLAQL